MHALHEAGGPSCALMFPCPFAWTPSTDETILCSSEILTQSCRLHLLSLVVLLPSRALTFAARPVARVSVAVHAGAAIRCRVEREDVLRDVGQKCAVVADHNHPSGSGTEPLGEVVESYAVEVVGGLIEQQEVIGSPRAGMPDAPDSVVRQRVRSSDGSGRFRR